MKRKTLAMAIVVLSLSITMPAQAVDWQKIFCLPWCVPNCVEPTCCDDYCPKPMPCVPKIKCFGCDDYCPKCEPCTKKICRFGCDDYCYKCPPKLLCAPCADLKCAPTTSVCGTCSHCNGTACNSSCSSCQSHCDKR